MLKPHVCTSRRTKKKTKNVPLKYWCDDGGYFVALRFLFFFCVHHNIYQKGKYIRELFIRRIYILNIGKIGAITEPILENKFCKKKGKSFPLFRKHARKIL